MGLRPRLPGFANNDKTIGCRAEGRAGVASLAGILILAAAARSFMRYVDPEGWRIQASAAMGLCSLDIACVHTLDSEGS